jgi:hypothetical protein
VSILANVAEKFENTSKKGRMLKWENEIKNLLLDCSGLCNEAFDRI